jgi:thermostable 8-oxoguanine DNA glycosylase
VNTNARLSEGLNSPRFANWRSQRRTIQSLVKKLIINFQPLKCGVLARFHHELCFCILREEEADAS